MMKKLQPINKGTPKFFADGFEFYDLYVADASTAESGWREFTIEIDSTYIFTVKFAPCDWAMHPGGKNMTVNAVSISRRLEVGIREAVRLHDESVRVYGAAIAGGKSPREAKALSQFEVIAASEECPGVVKQLSSEREIKTNGTS